MQAPTRRHVGILPLVALAACLASEPPQVADVGNVDLAAAAPSVTAAELGPTHVELTFSRAMPTDAATDALRLWRLRGHAVGDLAATADLVSTQASWRDERRLLLQRPTAAGHYVLELDPLLRDRAGRALDGLVDGPEGGLLRPDDDGLDSPSAWRSLLWTEGDPAEAWWSLPARPALVVTEVTGWHAGLVAGVRDEEPNPMWNRGQPRLGRRSPTAGQSSLRIAFGSDAGWPWSLVGATAVEGAITVLDESGGAQRLHVDLARIPGVLLSGGERPRVTAVAGRTVTLSGGPPAAWASLRGPHDPVWARFSEVLPPAGLVARVEGWNRPTLELAADPVPVTGAILGATATTDRRWPNGALDGGYSLWSSAGVEYPIAAATGPVLYLRTPVTEVVDCAPCELRFERAEERIAVDAPVRFLSHVWYVHPAGEWPSGRILKLIINAGNRLRSLMGQPLRDEERDGNEVDLPAIADDEFILQFSLRSDRAIEPTVSRINDGSLYPTLFAGGAWPCLSGDPKDPVCVQSVIDENCSGREVPASLSFSFYTADGDAAHPRGVADLIEVGRFNQAHVTLLAGETGQALDRVVSARTVLHQTADGTFPTTLLTLDLRGTDVKACAGETSGLRGLRAGDVLVIDHRIRPVVPADPRLIDGNGDGVASASPADDWVGIWDPALGRFLPLDRRPRR